MGSLLSEGVVIALGSASVYLITFFYERGYCDHFQIPASFINPNVTTILVAAVSIGFLLLTSMQFFGFAIPFFRAAFAKEKNAEPYRLFFAVNGVMALSGIFLLKVYGLSLKGALTFLILAFVINFFLFGIGLIAHRKEKTLADRFMAMKPAADDPFDIWQVVDEKLGRRTLLVILLLVVSSGAAYLIGNGEASRQTRFLVFKNPADYVLLRTYGDVMIAAPLERVGNVVGRELLLLRASTKDTLEFHMEEFEPLELKSLKPKVAAKAD